MVTGLASTTLTVLKAFRKCSATPFAAGAVANDGDARAIGDAVGKAHETFEAALTDRMVVLGELLDRAVIDHQHRFFDALAQGGQAHPARGGLLRPPAQFRIGSFGVAREQVAAVIQEDVGVAVEDLIQEFTMPRSVLGLFRQHFDPVCLQVFNRFRLGAVQVAGRDHVCAAGFEGQQQFRRLGFQVDGGADGQTCEGLVVREFRGGLFQQAAVLHPPSSGGSVGISDLFRYLAWNLPLHLSDKKGLHYLYCTITGNE